jgi:hypothetical protein
MGKSREKHSKYFKAEMDKAGIPKKDQYKYSESKTDEYGAMSCDFKGKECEVERAKHMKQYRRKLRLIEEDKLNKSGRKPQGESMDKVNKAVRDRKKKQAADKLKSMTIRRKMEEKQHDKGNPKPYETKGDELKKYKDASKAAGYIQKARDEREERSLKMNDSYEDKRKKMRMERMKKKMPKSKETKGGLRY